MPKEGFDWPEPLASYRKWYDPSQSLADFLYQLGVALLKKGKMQDAICALTNSYQQTPSRPQLAFYLAMAYHQLGDWLQALAYYREALKYEPKAAKIYNNMGTIFETLQALPQAMQFYRQAILHDQKHADAFYNIGNLRRKENLVEEAVRFYRKALLIKPRFLEAWVNLAPMLRQLNDIDAALYAYQQILQIDPKNASAAHWTKALSNNIPTPNQTENYITDLFEEYDENKHNNHPLINLAPKHLPSILAQIPGRPIASCLELCYKKGLVGEQVRAEVTYLEAWDLSKTMITITNKEAIYDQIYQQDIRVPRDDQNCFALILCIDVIPYLGELSLLVACIQKKLDRGGWFILTTEHREHENTSEIITDSSRHTHHPSQVAEFAKLCGLEIQSQIILPLRQHNHTSIDGGFYLMRKLDWNNQAAN